MTLLSKKKQYCQFGSFLAILALLWLPSSRASVAGTLVEEHLDSVHEVHPRVLIGGLRYESFAGFEPNEFQEQAQKQVSDQLRRCGIDLSKASRFSFSIELSISRNGLPNGWIALHADAELREPAVLERKWGDLTKDQAEIFVTTWRRWEFTVVEEEKARSRLSRMTSDLSKEFAETIAEARATSVLDTEGEICSDPVE